MIAVFYDRKHGCEVTSAQLMGANVVESYATCGDSDDKQRPALEELWNSSRVVGELAYKTPECPKHQHWDRCLMTGDLVFLRIEEAEEALPMPGRGVGLRERSGGVLHGGRRTVLRPSGPVHQAACA